MPKPTVPKREPSEGLRAKPEPSGGNVEVSSLPTLQPFNYNGRIYIRRQVLTTGVRAISKDKGKLILLPPDTLVTPID